MHNRDLTLWLILFSFLSISSCSEDKVGSPILVFLTPSEAVIEAKSNQHVFITVKSSTNDGSSINLAISSTDIVYGLQPLLDSTFTSRNINFIFDFIVPQYPDSTELLLVFNLRNNVNDQIQIAKRILVNKGESLVKENSGDVFYSLLSDKPNAYSIDKFSPGYLSDSVTFAVDIVDDSNSKDNADESISRRWVSYTGLNFVKFNGFNYAAANSLTIKNAYESGIKLSKLTGIADSDIIIVGRGSTAIGAIQIIAVTDQVGVQDDKYTFSIKKITK